MVWKESRQDKLTCYLEVKAKSRLNEVLRKALFALVVLWLSLKRGGSLMAWEASIEIPSPAPPALTCSQPQLQPTHGPQTEEMPGHSVDD